ncbi:unnamed protein product [Chondrus crispus]|uniref:Uncharacterized protein n=1 Tax=Chondrus crispus TaxID=2769 RepID=R7QRS5_CHOCR|nr:unnamed protein product [Chondrus crispus]CDF40206.1 unnamed protein product [Chondrus crispus]|eukprot:XP_005710500.1 unnamed protein product [Chondrus crispus]
MHRAVKDGVEPVKQLLLVMALCHSVVPEPKDETQSDNSSGDSGRKKSKKRSNPDLGDNTAVLDGNSSEEALPEYQGQSPDEVALVTSARE